MKKKPKPDEVLVNKFSDVLIYSRAGSVLPLAICKTLNDQMDRFSTFSNPTFPLSSHIPAQSPMFTPRPLSCSVTKYERSHNCHSIQFVSVLATFAAMMSSAGVRVTVRCRRTRRKMQKLKEKVTVTIVYASLGEIAANSISELKHEGCGKVNISSI